MTETKYDPRASRTMLDRAEAALADGDSKAALTALQDAFEHDPFNEELPLLAAALQLRAEDPIRAAHLAVEALRARPFHPEALDVLAVSYIGALQPDLARKLLSRAVTMAPGLANLRNNLDDAKRKSRELRRSGVPREEIHRASLLLPRKALNRLTTPEDPLLSVGIVVRKGEEHALRGCIESIQALASQIVVVDARGEHAEPLETVDEAQETFRWKASDGGTDAFNEARRRANKDWVLLLTANERLMSGDAQVLRAAMGDNGSLAHVLAVRCAAGVARHAVRLVRNAPGVAFSGRLDPSLGPCMAGLEGRWGLEVKECGAEILAEPGVDLESAIRDAAVRESIESDLQAQPGDWRARLDRARILFEDRQTHDAMHLVRQCRRELLADPSRRRPMDLEDPTTLEARCLARLGLVDELAALIDEYHALCRPSANTLFLEAAVAREQGDGERTFRCLRAAADWDGVTFVPLLPEVRGATLPHLLGALHMERGELELAEQQFRLAVSRDASNLEARLGLVALGAAAGQVKSVLEELDRLIESDGEDDRVWITGGIVLGMHPSLAPATADWFCEANRRLPDNHDIRRRLGDAQLRCGRAEEAIESWSQLEPTEASGLTSARMAAALASDTALPGPTGSPEAGLQDELLIWFQNWLDSGAYEALDRALMRLPEAEHSSPGLLDRTADWLERTDQSEAAARLREREPAAEPL